MPIKKNHIFPIINTFFICIAFVLTFNNHFFIENSYYGTTNQLNYLLLGVAGCSIFLWSKKLAYIRKLNYSELLIGLGSLILAFFLVAGSVIRTTVLIDKPYLQYLLVLIGFTILVEHIFQTIFWGFDHLAISSEVSSRHLILKIWLIISICWLPYFIIFYPGVGPYDFACQLANFFGFPDLYYNFTSAYLQTGNFLNDHMPIATTILSGLFASFGVHTFHSVNLGIAIYTFIQMFVTSYIVASSLAFLNRLGIKKWFLFGLIGVFSLVPFFPFWAISLAKNILLADLTIWLMILLLELVIDQGVFKQSRWVISYLCCSLLLVFIVKYGFIIALISSLALLFLHGIKKTRVLLWCIIPIILTNFTYQHIIIPEFNVTPGDPIESLSIPIQQVSRVVRYHPQTISNKQRKIINRVFDYKKIGKNYTPGLADPVKFNTLRRKTVKSADLKQFIKVWFELLFKNFGTYVNAYLRLVSGYLDLNTFTWSYYNGIDTSVSLGKLTHGKYQLSNPSGTLKGRNLLLKITRGLQSIPILTIFFRPVYFVWLVIMSAIYLLKEKKIPFLLPLLPLLLQLMVCLMSPVNGNPRYMLSFSFAISVVFAVIVAAKKKDPNKV